MGMISPAQIADLNARADCVDLARQFGAVLRRADGASSGKMIGSCPICASANPRAATRFEVSRAKWVCAVCPDGGDALGLVQKATGRSFREAVEFLGGPRELSADEQARIDAKRAADDARAKAESDAFRAREIETCRAIWQTAAVGDLAPVRAYLEGRGLEIPQPFFGRAVDKMPFFHGTTADDYGRRMPRVIHRGPAMLAALASPHGAFCGLHVTWIDPARPGCKAEIANPDWREGDDPKTRLLSAKKMRGSAGAACIRLTRCDALADPAADVRLFMGEGIETTLSARMFLAKAGLLRDADAFWCAGSLGNLGGPALDSAFHPEKKHANGRRHTAPNDHPDFSRPAIAIPGNVRRLVLLGDGDSDAFTTRLALDRGCKRFAAAGRAVSAVFAEAGKDFNDMWREIAA